MKKLVLVMMAAAGLNLYAVSDNGIDRDMREMTGMGPSHESVEMVNRSREGAAGSKTEAEMESWIFANMNRRGSGSRSGR